MLRRALMMILCVCAFGLCLGCGNDNKPTNPDNLEYGKDGPPKRDALKDKK
jgi:hypothetical protein